ncbi:MAG: AraC family transcriptional regulator [Verrucomicrobiota bacterium]
MNQQKQLFSEQPYWSEIGGWSPVCGDFYSRGISVEHHQFTVDHTTRWSDSFHPGSFELCIQLEGVCRETSAKQTQQFTSPSLILYETTTAQHFHFERTRGPHHFVTLEIPRDHFKNSNPNQPISLPLTPTALELAELSKTAVPSGLELKVLAKAYQLLAETQEQLSSKQGLFCENWKTEHESRITRVKEYLKERMDQPLQLEGLAKAVGCSPHYLSRTFSQTEGQTISQFLKQLRLNTAAQLLGQGNLNVTEVALEVGYNSLSHFSRAFSDRFDCCPCSYRLRATNATK